MDSFSFVQTLQLKEEGRQYLSLIQNIQLENRGLGREQGYELHHIHPQALGGVKDTTNLIKLTIREHIEAHYLLALVFGGSMYYAFWMLTGRTIKTLSDVDDATLERWAVVRKQALGQFSCPKSKETREKIAAAHRGKVQSEESNQKRSKALKGRVSPNKGKKVSESVLQKMKEKQKEIHTRPEYLKKLKEAQNNPELKRRRSEQMKGHVTSEETRRKLSIASKGRTQSLEHIANRSKALQGNICVFKEGKGTRIRPEALQDYLNLGYSRTRKESFSKELSE